MLVAGLLLVGLVGAADYFTGEELDVAVFYLLPILLVTWRVGQGAGYLFCLLSAADGLVYDLLRPHLSHPAIPYWNAAVRFSVFVVAAYGFGALHAAYTRLRAAEAMRDDLTNMLVHDLKNPVVSVSMALDLLRRQQQAGGAALTEGRVAELLRVAAESNDRLRRLVEDILDVAKAENDCMLLNRAETDLAQVVRAAVEEVRPRAQRAELTLEGKYPEAPLLCLLDAEKIRRVVDNLLDNGLKHSPPGGRIEVAVAQQGAEARVTVRDEGQGIPEHLHGHIFEKYRQAEATGAGQRASVGLGLAFAKLAVESHGGRIWVESRAGSTTTFVFTLPLANRPVPDIVE